jgi:hypothetical protein
VKNFNAQKFQIETLFLSDYLIDDVARHRLPPREEVEDGSGLSPLALLLLIFQLSSLELSDTHIYEP